MANLPRGKIQFYDNWQPVWNVDPHFQEIKPHEFQFIVDQRINSIQGIMEDQPIQALGELIRALAFVGAAIASQPNFYMSLQSILPNWKPILLSLGKKLGASTIDISVSATGLSVGFSFPVTNG